MCPGPCEGMGCYPENNPSDPAWQRLHAAAHGWPGFIRAFLDLWHHPEWWYIKDTLRRVFQGFPCDGWHFVLFPDCSGTGNSQAA